MSMMEKWKNSVSADEEAKVQKAMDQQAANQSNRREVPSGDYAVVIDKLEVGQASWGDDQVNIWFKIIEGDFKNNRIFYSGSFDDNWLHGINVTAVLIADMLDDEGMTSAAVAVILGKHSQRGGMDQIREFIADAAEMIVGKMSYDLSYTIKDSKSRESGRVYKNKFYQITDVYTID